MKVRLMHPQKDMEWRRGPSPQEQVLIHDLGLNPLLDVMSGGDELVRAVAIHTLLSSLGDVSSISYRQAILQDAIAHPEWLRMLYQLASDALDSRKRSYFGMYARHSTSILHESASLLEILITMLRRLQKSTNEQPENIQSQGLIDFASRIQEQLPIDYLDGLELHVKALQGRQGYLFSGRLDWTLKGTDLQLRRRTEPVTRWRRIFGHREAEFTFHIPDRDESGFRALSALEDRGVQEVAGALQQSTNHILTFFSQLRAELAFYIGCLNLYQAFLDQQQIICFPEPFDKEWTLDFTDLVNPSLLLTDKEPVVGNDLHSLDKQLLVITGANHGGKSTFLRSLGLAQLMMQCGMFVAAKTFRATIVPKVHTHFKHEEDVDMQSGKLDEELSRMSDIIDAIQPGDLLLLNESFAATNEREGTDLATEIVQALLDCDIQVIFVTHLHAFANEWFRIGNPAVLFLRAERLADSSRTFKIQEAPPLETSFGPDLYHQTFTNRPTVESREATPKSEHN